MSKIPYGSFGLEFEKAMKNYTIQIGDLDDLFKKFGLFYINRTQLALKSYHLQY